MKTITDLLRKNHSYFFGCFAFLLAGTLLLVINGESALAMPLSSPHPFWLNVFFINYTFIGDGIFAIILTAAVLFYFRKKQEGLALLNATLLSAVTIQIIKNFNSFANPTLFFEQGQYLFATNGSSSINDPASVSGHTAIAFAMATVLVGVMKNKKWQVPVLIASIAVGYSRMYLAQHTLLSVMIGGVIGISFGFVSLLIASGKFKFSKIRKQEFVMPGEGLWHMHNTY